VFNIKYFPVLTLGIIFNTKYWDVLSIENCGKVYLHKMLGNAFYLHKIPGNTLLNTVGRFNLHQCST
jgi:hypothetical protein